MEKILSKMPSPKFGNWLKQSAEDYAAARCCLINGMFPGFVLAQQAVEKTLKAYIQIIDPDWKASKKSGVLDDVTFSHDLLMYAQKVDKHYPSLKLQDNFGSLLELLSKCFEGKYPNGKSHPKIRSTSSLLEIDCFLVPLLKDIPIAAEVRVRTGIYPALWSSAGVDDRSPCPEWVWLMKGNVVLQGCISEMVSEIRREIPYRTS